MPKLIIVIVLSLLLFDCGKDRPKPPSNTNTSATPSPSPSIEPTPIPVLSPTPSPTPETSPIITPTPESSPYPLAEATPYPTPQVDPLSYIKQKFYVATLTISLSRTRVDGSGATAGEIAALVDALPQIREEAHAKQDVGLLLKRTHEAIKGINGYVLVKLEGGGPIKTQSILYHDTTFDSSEYSCEIQGITDQGQILIADDVVVRGTWRIPQTLIDYFQHGDGSNWQDPYLQKVQALTAEELAGTGTTILEPTFVGGDPKIYPAIEVFQALGDTTRSHTDLARNIAVIGFHIKGRQRTYDGGVRSTILFGNCHNCTAQHNYLEDTGSIGILMGGSALERDNFSNNGLIWHNVTSGVAAANLAAINSENLIIAENYVRRPGHHDPRFGGGVCGFDLETNSPADHTKNIGVYNNLFDYEGAAFQSAGNALCLQDPYHGPNHGKVIAANNVVIGGRGVGFEPLNRFMSNGMILVGLKQCEIINNYVFRTGQNALQAYALDGCLVQDNDFESTGGGGNSTMVLNGVVNSAFRRNRYRDRPGLNINVHSGFLEWCNSKGNVYEDNEGNTVVSRPEQCP